MGPTIDQARTVKDKVRGQLRHVNGYKGIGISWTETGAPFVEVSVAPGTKDEFRRRIRSRVDDVEIRISELGQVIAYDDE